MSMPRNEIRPRSCRLHSGQRANERRLAGAIGADDGDDGTLLYFERNVIKRLDVAIEYVEVFDEEHQTASTPR